MTVGAVVAAAGLSRRMGREKVLLPFGRSTILETILETLCAVEIVGDVVVVVRPDLPESADRARRAGARAIVNPSPGDEMLSSLRLGIGILSTDLDAFFVWPADHPLVRRNTIRTLAGHARADRATIPLYRGRRGHPALIGRDLTREIEERELPGGLRDLWRVRAEVVGELETDDPGVAFNVDTHAEYERALAMLAAGTEP